ncbi:MAG TPA: M20/M25/M40 family metallo-hydrolase [Methanomassiliicoccales archaeon]
MAEGVVETLIDMILIGSEERENKDEIVKYASDWLKDLGMEVDIVGDKRYPAICAYNGFRGVALSGHLDTVPIGDRWTKDQGEMSDGKVFGRGSADMKGGCAAMLHSAKALMADDLDCYLLFTTDEEDLMTGANALIRTHGAKNARAIVIGEPTNMRPVYKEKGVARVGVKAFGKASHASMPWLGENAIMTMSRLLDKLGALNAEGREAAEGLTMNATTIKGGDMYNVIPDECEVDLDVRFPASMSAHEVFSSILATLKGEDCELALLHEFPAFGTDPESPLVKAATAYLREEPMAVPYATEAAVYAKVNPNILICGPGDTDVAHTADEFVEMAQLEQAVQLYIHLAKTLIQG